MNFKMKALVAAAVAVMSVSSAANAFDKGGDSSVFLTVFDRASNISAVFDLGFNYQAFSVGGTESSASFSWDLSTGDNATAWNTFFASANVANVKWGVAAFDDVGAVANAGSYGLITTMNLGANVPNINTNLLTALTPKLITYLTANEANGNVSTKGNGLASSIYYGANGSINNRAPNGLANLGVEQGVVQYLSGTGPLGFQKPTVYEASFVLGANGVLQYTVTAVPEPETYALLMAGLGLVGFAARRRKSA